MRLGAIRRFRKDATDLRVPHWPALAFPTRPLRIDEIGLVAPSVLSNPVLFRNAIRFLRGAEVASKVSLGFKPNDDKSPLSHFLASGKARPLVRVAVTSL